MSDPDAYVALVVSLPSSERLFVAKRPPLSRLRLQRRLSALSEDDARTLARIEGLLSWSAYDRGSDLHTLVSRAKVLMADLPQRTLRRIVDERMELRTAMAALRMRQGGAGAPEGAWGYGVWTSHIAANWREPAFGLDRSMPWLRRAGQLLETGDPLALQRHLLDVTFRQLQRHAGRHHFDFEAVVIYVLKWNIFDRWAKADSVAAAQRFTELSEEALQNFPHLQAEGVGA
ncbi:hypothetical protein KUV51_18655 [Tateyamaria omphalii]|uniref:hypothetical protein n=1 Tax=Tateyamaria omphalii TaxID=299262 RepID=UPI001C99BC26|nr:hypothetical protein [Tateyamaria omphalii]MBY5935032.1 hypothetical protein [Tateyamaria omphalii]